jgi:hypothetical protein
MGWKEAAQRTIVGDKVELKTFPGYWIKPKKYSVSGKDAINEEQRKLQQSIDKKALASMIKKLDIDSDGKDEAQIMSEVMDTLTDEELAAMMDSQYVPSASYIKVRLNEGIHAHNFCDGPETQDVSSFAQDILDYPEIAEEILKVVEEYNRPLAKKSTKKSKMQPNGSTTEQPLNGETPSPTEESQPKS